MLFILKYFSCSILSLSYVIDWFITSKNIILIIKMFKNASVFLL